MVDIPVRTKIGRAIFNQINSGLGMSRLQKITGVVNRGYVDSIDLSRMGKLKEALSAPVR